MNGGQKLDIIKKIIYCILPHPESERQYALNAELTITRSSKEVQRLHTISALTQVLHSFYTMGKKGDKIIAKKRA